MTLYQIFIHSKSYNDWSVKTFHQQEPITSSEILVLCNPIENTLFHNDVFFIQADKVILSQEYPNPIRQKGKKIPGVLLLQGNKTYGREKKENNKQGKLFYKVIPNNPYLPEFLIPYEENHTEFVKIKKNKYIVFQFLYWDHHTNKHPLGQIIETIGPIDVLANFYQYELECKELIFPFPKTLKSYLSSLALTLPNKPIETMKMASDTIKTQIPFVFTIDSATTRDYDDAFSILYYPDLKETELTIYISNVGAILDKLNLLEHLSNRVSTIYLPNKTVPMLPENLSQNICSLVEVSKCKKGTEIKQTFALIIHISDDYTKPWTMDIQNKEVIINRNFVYESDELVSNECFCQLEKLTQKIFTWSSTNSDISKIPLFNFVYIPKDSMEIVSYWMLFMNYHCATILQQQQQMGIFRNDLTKLSIRDYQAPNEHNNLVPDNVYCAINRYCGESVGEYSTDYKNCEHNTLDIPCYTHITSPIRRIVDVVNMMQIQIHYGLVSDIDSKTRMNVFIEKWTTKEAICFINEKMRATKKVQNQCQLLDLCSKISMINGQKTYQGYVFNKMETIREKTSMQYKWNIYIPELRIFSTIHTNEEYKIHKNIECRLVFIENESSFRKKIRIQEVLSLIQ